MPMPRGFTQRPGFAPEKKLDVGDEVTGRLIAYRIVDIPERGGSTRSQPLIQLETEPDKRVVSIWLGSNLEDRITKDDIGKRVWIQRTADTVIDGRPSPMKTYDCAVEG